MDGGIFRVRATLAGQAGALIAFRARLTLAVISSLRGSKMAALNGDTVIVNLGVSDANMLCIKTNAKTIIIISAAVSSK